MNWIIAFTTPLFLAKSSSGPYFLFGGCSLVATLVCVAFLPETRGTALEELDQAFGESPWRTMFGSRLGGRRTSTQSESKQEGGVELAEVRGWTDRVDMGSELTK